MTRLGGLLTVAFVGLAVGTSEAADATGTWKWSFTGQDGQTRETTLKLKQEGTKLTGTVTGRNNTEIEIKEGKAEGEQVTFQVTREFNGNMVVTKYKGTLEGDTITGTSESERDGQTRSREWVAKRSK